jgi:hypothetical protein
MYPISLGYEEAERRIRKLLTNGHSAEALVTAFFTLEKTLKRTLLFLAIKRGFTSKQAKKLFEKTSFNQFKDVWPIFYKDNKTLPDIFGNTHWQKIQEVQKKRNALVHGARVFKLTECAGLSEEILLAHSALRERLNTDLGFNGWQRLPTRFKPALPWM